MEDNVLPLEQTGIGGATLAAHQGESRRLLWTGRAETGSQQMCSSQQGGRWAEGLGGHSESRSAQHRLSCL